MKQQSFLTELPFPLAPPVQTELLPALFQPVCNQPGQNCIPGSIMMTEPNALERLYTRSQNLLVDIGALGIKQSEAEYFTQELDLMPFYGNYYLPVGAPITPMLRSLLIEKLLPASFIRRGRISRLTAAWVWGYYPTLETPMHLDFDRVLRLNASRAKDRQISIHQVRVLAFDSFTLGKVSITTPPRTAVDLLLNDASENASCCLQSMFSDPSRICQPDKIQEAIDRIPYVRGRKEAKKRLEELAS